MRIENTAASCEATIFRKREHRRDDSSEQEQVQHNIDTGSAERDKNAYVAYEKT